MRTPDNRPQTATDIAYGDFKRDLLTCELAPGSFLTESALAEATGHGRAAVREALGRLTMEGLVEVQPRRGYRVTAVSLTDVREIFGMRLLLEPHAAEQAALHAPREEILDLHDLAHAAFVSGDRDSYAAYIEANRMFHTRLARASGNYRLAAAIQQLLEEMQRVLFLSLATRGSGAVEPHEHHELYDVVLDGDARKARDVAVQQIAAARARVIDSLL